MKALSLLAVLAASTVVVPAFAQDRDPSQDFDGPYISIGGGGTLQGSDRGETVLFDTNRDGTYGDQVTTVGGANAFSTGFCNGAATSTANLNCRNDKDGPEYFARLGFDKRMGNFVLGAVIEGGRSVARDSVTAFSTTPASYTFSREADYQANARLRAGYTPGGGALFYVTGGGAYARLDNRFTTSNTANSFADNGKTNGWGYTAGGGAEIMVTNNIAVGLEYLYTDIKDNDFIVNVGQGTAPATNPFLLNGGGTDMKRSSDHFRTHSVRGTLSFRF
jgi:outer membrane immunogenic protein